MLGSFTTTTVALASCSAAAAVYVVVKLVGPIVFPEVIPYPWPRSVREKNKTVALAGSFNPPHKGHVAMLLYLAQR